ncbi:Cell fate regulator YlbF, YheA/YmcA/DUF963 family (controls sporulation, competence, biofilm development) [Alkalispirochaeta americana]|uniref:Cell fate regulator YlbF, YheA/YmcA/DUF963 family (Controls sporulation, competence, biofilm development) n=1 Tax=Alkalispirochaeta americana TaxID=159291 RepID=A0A1N6Q8E3_9SPIO|nr:YlbF family regulator [Alkalispirochaeta americana]SIQ12799.1 Cell fate regulator YlbF, YheA/YmcA/DUF963 family (controls sporulation, competence, biofilm development) [Alkalispirochaeta americana]
MNQTMTHELDQATEALAEALEQEALVLEYQKASREFETNQDLQALRQKYTRLAQDLHSKQIDGTLTQEDITGIRSLQSEMQNHPAMKSFLEVREKTVELLSATTHTISQVVGFDFSATAAPPSSCCG